MYLAKLNVTWLGPLFTSTPLMTSKQLNQSSLKNPLKDRNCEVLTVVFTWPGLWRPRQGPRIERVLSLDSPAKVFATSEFNWPLAIDNWQSRNQPFTYGNRRLGSITSLIIRPGHSYPFFHGVVGHLDLLQHARRLHFDSVIPCGISCRTLSLH